MQLESLRDWLRRRMRARKVSWRKLETQSGVSRGAIEKILKNPAHDPEVETLTRLAKWDGIPVADLIRRAGYDPGDDRPSPDEITQRTIELALRNPGYREVCERLINAPPGKIETVRAFLAYLESHEPGEPPPDGSPDQSAGLN